MLALTVVESKCQPPYKCGSYGSSGIPHQVPPFPIAKGSLEIIDNSIEQHNEHSVIS